MMVMIKITMLIKMMRWSPGSYQSKQWKGSSSPVSGWNNQLNHFASSSSSSWPSNNAIMIIIINIRHRVNFLEWSYSARRQNGLSNLWGPMYTMSNQTKILGNTKIFKARVTARRPLSICKKQIQTGCKLLAMHFVRCSYTPWMVMLTALGGKAGFCRLYWQLLSTIGNYWELLATICNCAQLLATIGTVGAIGIIGNYWQLLATPLAMALHSDNSK